MEKCSSKVKRVMERTKFESQKVCGSEWRLNWKEKYTLPKQVVSVFVAASKEQPGLSKYGLGVRLSLLLSESQTTDVSGQSIQTDTGPMEESPSSQQKAKEEMWRYWALSVMTGVAHAQRRPVCLRKDIICIIKFHPSTGSITISSCWKWN